MLKQLFIKHYLNYILKKKYNLKFLKFFYSFIINYLGYHKKIKIKPKLFFFKLNLYILFLNIIFKNGKKQIINLFFSTVLKKIIFLKKININFIFIKLFKKLNIRVEIRKIRHRKRTTIIPFYITYKRKFSLIFRWFINLIKESSKKFKVSFFYQFFYDVLNILYNNYSSVIKNISANNSLAFKFRSNANYRW